MGPLKFTQVILHYHVIVPDNRSRYATFRTMAARPPTAPGLPYQLFHKLQENVH